MNHWAKLFLRPFRLYQRSLSLRLSLMVATAMIILLLVTLIIMFLVSRQAMRDDALYRASQTLEGAMVKVDNIMLSMEETAGNMYYNLQPLIDNPDTMFAFSRKIVEANPCIVGCAIAYKPGYLEGRESFMAYTHRNGNIHERHQESDDSVVICRETFDIIPYSEQVWFTRTLETNEPMWLNPLEGIEAGLEPLILFCLPIRNNRGTPVAVMTVGVSISLLSATVAATKPSPNSYCALMDRNGTFIVNPTGGQVPLTNAFSLPDAELHEVVEAVLSGQTGNMPLSVGGQDFHVFYRPFEQAVVPNRSMGHLKWSIAVAMSTDDIFGVFYRYFNNILIIAFGGMVLLFLLSWVMLYLRLRPLKMLTGKTERIAQGHYNEPIPETQNQDEIGRLQRDFIKMRRALAAQISELEQLTATIQERGDNLQVAYRQAKKAEKLKTAFLRHMTNQMLEPAQAIDRDVTALCTIGDNGVDSEAEAAQRVERIQQNGDTIAQLLSQLLNLSEDEMRKEVEHA